MLVFNVIDVFMHISIYQPVLHLSTPFSPEMLVLDTTEPSNSTGLKGVVCVELKIVTDLLQ